MLRASSGDPSDPVEILLDDLMDTPVEDRVSVRPDLAAVAVLTARAIEAEPGLTRILRRGSPVVAITTHTADRVASVKKVIEICSLPSERTVVTNHRYSRPGRDEALIVAREGTDKGDKPDSGNEAIANALYARSTIIGIAPEPRRQLPRDLMRSAEYRLVLPEMDQSALALVIEAVTGKHPEQSIDPTAIRLLDIADLVLALRPDRTGGVSVTARGIDREEGRVPFGGTDPRRPRRLRGGQGVGPGTRRRLRRLQGRSHRLG